MNLAFSRKRTYFHTILLGLLAILLAGAIVAYPDTAFHASLKGLKIWWDIIFPALLPFLITSEILLGFGVVQFMGVLLEPLMKPLFRVPGVGAFVLAMGFASGYPMGAKLTSRLREQGLISQIEGERLVSFTTTSDPLFLFGAIAVGFFHDARLGIVLAIIHYSSSIIVGIMMRYYRSNVMDKTNLSQPTSSENIVLRALRAMHQARISEQRKFGKLMGDAVMSSIETLLMIGGFIMIFSVILSILTKIQITLIFAKLINLILIPLGISTELAGSIIYGFFEVTLGAQSVSDASTGIPYLQRIAIVSAISAWGGISVHAQVAAILQRTDVRYTPFLLARVLHFVVAFFLSLLLWNPLSKLLESHILPVFMYQIQANSISFNMWDAFMYIGSHFIYFISILLFISLSIHLLRKS